MTRRAVGYVRVSTEDQAREGVSLDAQRTRLQAYAATYGLNLVAVYEDAGLSGKTLERPGLKAVLEALGTGSASAVVVYKLDRLSRSVRDLLALVEDRFKPAGIELHSISEKLDTSNALGRFFFTLTGALAEMERALIGERTKAALAHLKAQGVELGTTPTGFRREGRRLVPVAGPESEAVARIVALREEKGLPYAEIADRLNAEGFRPKRGARWYGSSVRSVYRRHARASGSAAPDAA